MDYNKEKQFRKLNQEVESIQLQVIRDGKNVSISRYDLVVGDVVRLSIGDIIEADGIFIQGFDVSTDESALTGEPIAISKSSTAPFILSGSSVQAGQGTYLVLAVGVNSENGRIQAMIRGQKVITTTAAGASSTTTASAPAMGGAASTTAIGGGNGEGDQNAKGIRLPEAPDVGPQASGNKGPRGASTSPRFLDTSAQGGGVEPDESRTGHVPRNKPSTARVDIKSQRPRSTVGSTIAKQRSTRGTIHNGSAVEGGDLALC